MRIVPVLTTPGREGWWALHHNSEDLLMVLPKSALEWAGKSPNKDTFDMRVSALVPTALDNDMGEGRQARENLAAAGDLA